MQHELGPNIRLEKDSFVSGGCINNTLKLQTNQGDYFLKYKENEPELFVKEGLGLKLLRSGPIRIPQVIATGSFDGQDYLLLEFIEKAQPSSDFWMHFGSDLADQHRLTNDRFGLAFDNHIGRLPQRNTWSTSWSDFFIHHRLEPQLQMAETNRLLPEGVRARFELLNKSLPSLVPSEPASLLHGDLWSGNFMVGSDGQAVIFDPATYYGHRETELAFTKMFGGFDAEFYQAYQANWPLAPGFDERVMLHNLYPQLVHLNLFGTAYLSGIQQTLDYFTR